MSTFSHLKTVPLTSCYLAALFLFMMMPVLCYAQITFERNYGSDEDDISKCVRQTSDDGYIICGYTRSFSADDYDAYILRTDAYGDTLWTRVLGGPGFDAAYSLVITPDSGYLIVGNYLDPGKAQTDIWLIRMDDNGDTLWTRHNYSATNAEAHAVRLTLNDGYIVTGVREDAGGTGHLVLMETDAGGNELWSHDYPYWSTSGGNAVIATNDDGYLACGYIDTYNPTWNRNLGLVKTNSQGDTLWTRQFGGSAYEIGWSVCEGTTGGYLAAGYTTGFGAAGGDGYFVKTTDQGMMEWQYHVGKTGLDIIYDISTTSDFNYIATGISGEQGSEFQEAWLLKLNETGDTLWSQSYGGYRKSYGYSVEQTSDLGYIFCGSTNASGTNVYDVMLVKTNPDGLITARDEPQARSDKLQIYPNPAHGPITVIVPPGSERMIITSLSGKIILDMDISLKQKVSADLQIVPSGMYLIEVIHPTSTLLEKLIIQ
ncbi:MAG: T9SS type A sorting domain-containing protein [Bacteroidales bacterium]|nr:T9SS type A sorting domain-containing protein [Bacteroidales bacterium]